MVEIEDLKVGLVVYGKDGRRVGKITALGASMFQVQTGFFNRRRFLLHLSDVDAVAGRTALLRVTRKQAHERPGYGDYGYADRGMAGDPRESPDAGIGAGLASAYTPNPAVQLAREQTEQDRTDAGIAGDGGHRDSVLGPFPPRVSQAPAPDKVAAWAGASTSGSDPSRPSAERPDLAGIRAPLEVPLAWVGPEEEEVEPNVPRPLREETEAATLHAAPPDEET